MKKVCGGCTGCCQIVPVRELGTKPFQGCPHIRSMLHVAGPGCGIYEKRPLSCRGWRCGWLENEDWEDDLRPDRCGFIVDPELDLIRVNGVERPAAQIWVLPRHEDAYERHPALAVILALLDKGVDVLWRQSGGSRAIRLNASGKVECSAVTAHVRPEIIGSEGERLLRAERLYRSGTALARRPRRPS